VDVTLSVLADYATVSQDGKLSVMGIFQEINPPTLPFALPQMYLVVSYSVGPAEFDTVKDIKIALLDNDGEEMLALEGQVPVRRPPRPGTRAYMNQIIGLSGVTFERPGDYGFAILAGGETKGTVSLHVSKPIQEVPNA
jgi:hypothetical protein